MGNLAKIMFVPLVLVWLGSVANAADRPNVVLIISDDQAWTDFGFMGHAVIETPNLDKLASQGARFANGYVTAPLCRASLSSIITGLHPHQNKIYSNDPPKGVDRNVMLPLLGNALTLPRMLKKAGYRSLQTGKFWEGHYANGGFTHGMTENKIRGRHGDVGLKIGRETMQPIYDFIDDSGDTPFFIWYAPMLPHCPHNPPKRLLDKYQAKVESTHLATYYAMCEWFDETCGQLLDYLDQKALADDTLIAFIVDNGWIQRKQRPKKGQFRAAPRSKATPYEGGVRTPVLLRWPNRIRPGDHPELVSAVDLAPTILNACGLKPTPHMPGVDLLPVATGSDKLTRDAVFGADFVHTAKVLGDPAANLEYRWIRRGKWKLIVPVDKSGHCELYNVADDPHEHKNLANTHPTVVKELTDRLNQWWPGRTRHTTSAPQ